eukprot:TRINITY_DN23619_c0_g1_i1.p2 TRINITY_DN23619_c0_g1~~TRINITY_DN23619_c0_g1_i1.p2  ORF type:complete len:395 (-),score=147.45 TRINITY_DN23619_c0_g1_i1:1390-2574(-)
MAAKNIFIVGAKRTAFGTFGGTFKNVTATQLQAHAAKAALSSGGVDPKLVDSVIVGNVAQSSVDAPYIARHVGLSAGVPIPTPALTINRLCGSGFQSIVNGAHEILVGESNVVLTGGTENMSQIPYSVRNIRFGTKLGQDPKLEDTLWAALTDQYAGLPMAITAENLAEQYGITRADCDEFSVRSQQLWAKANEAGHFKAEIEPFEIPSRKGPISFDTDEHPKPETTAEGLAKLPTVFKKDGVVTAGSASGICDGAAAVVIAGEDAVNNHGLKPLARLVAWHVQGVEPSIMGIGPVPAIQGVLQKAGLTVGDIDHFEINEAFAAQFIACERELGLPRDKCNQNGGAIALGHPLAASGSRITAHLTHQLQRGGKYAVGAACIGGGQGIAVLLEKM